MYVLRSLSIICARIMHVKNTFLVMTWKWLVPSLVVCPWSRKFGAIFVLCFVLAFRWVTEKNLNGDKKKHEKRSWKFQQTISDCKMLARGDGERATLPRWSRDDKFPRPTLHLSFFKNRFAKLCSCRRIACAHTALVQFNVSRVNSFFSSLM